MRWMTVLLLGVASSLARFARAEPLDPSSVRNEAERLRRDGRITAAIDHLKEAYERLPDSEQIAIALAQAYLADDNRVWAIRTLARHLDYRPRDCNARAMLVWVYLTAGMTDAADEVLAFDGCRSPAAVHTRWLLVRAFAAHLKDRPDVVRELLREARGRGAIFAEDRSLLNYLARSYEPERTALASGHVEMAAGWTTNGLAGSPVDQADAGTNPSGVLAVDALLRLVLPDVGLGQPLAEGRLRLAELTASGAHDLSYRTATGRAGLGIGASPRLEAAYAGELTQIASDDRYQPGRPLWFSEAHRFEYQLDLGNTFLLFGAAGRRHFRERVRTRSEVEQGVAWVATASWGTGLLGGISVRHHEANHQGYDLTGGTVVLELQQLVRRHFELRLGASASADVYPRSERYFATGAGIRRDEERRLRGGAWAIPFETVMAGVTYEMTSRLSTAEDYSFDDHRFFLKIRATSDSDRIRRRVVSARGRAALEFEESDAEDRLDTSDVRELIEQDESVRRGSTCLK